MVRWVEDLGTRATEKLICVCPRHMTHKILEELTMQVQFESFIQNRRFLKNFTVNPQIVIGVCTGGHCMNRNKALLFSTGPNRGAFERANLTRLFTRFQVSYWLPCYVYTVISCVFCKL